MSKLESLQSKFRLYKIYFAAIAVSIFFVVGYMFTSFAEISKVQIIIGSVLFGALVVALISISKKMLSMLNQIEKA